MRGRNPSDVGRRASPSNTLREDGSGCVERCEIDTAEIDLFERHRSKKTLSSLGGAETEALAARGAAHHPTGGQASTLDLRIQAAGFRGVAIVDWHADSLAA
jgi:hypothetical protein